MVCLETGCQEKVSSHEKNTAARFRFVKLDNLDNLKTSEWRCLATQPSTTSDKSPRQYITTNTSYQLSSTVMEGG